MNKRVCQEISKSFNIYPEFIHHKLSNSTLGIHVYMSDIHGYFGTYEENLRLVELSNNESIINFAVIILIIIKKAV